MFPRNPGTPPGVPVADPTRGPTITRIHLPHLHPEYEPTRATLHAYAKAMTVVSRAHGIAHPQWWHVSLKPRPEGLLTDPVPLPGGGALAFTMDLHHHEVVARTDAGRIDRFDLRSGMTGSDLGDALVAVATDLGLEGGYERDRYADGEERSYDPVASGAYFAAFTAVAAVFERHRVGLGMRVSPVQVWPHGFDLAFDWFGSRQVPHGEQMLPAQLNLGFYPGGTPYFYSNPWPFDPDLVGAALPHGATWQTEGWEGTMLPYEVVRPGDPAGILSGYARAVFDLVTPGLE